MPECAYINKILNIPRVLKYGKIPNMAKLSIWKGSQYASIKQHSEYARIWLDRVLNISWVLNMPGF